LVRGFADQRLRKPDNPLDPSNRRISLIVQYIIKDDIKDNEKDAKPGIESGEANKAGENSAPRKD
jgi:chemotaxis protein MotB